nr:MAG TPA: hypothetical protein [Caudoviricetes sp.]
MDGGARKKAPANGVTGINGGKSGNGFFSVTRDCVRNV